VFVFFNINSDKDIMKKNILTPSDKNVKSCVLHLEKEGLVSFPTETVYGLGGRVDLPKAVEKIFFWKGRPTSNPLIVHVYDFSQALDLFQWTHKEKEILEQLAKWAWPGPFTLVGLAKPFLANSLVTAHSPWVAVRVPHHPVALSLLKACQVPLAAPSANRWGHVSPTTADHVWEDFKERDILILDGGRCSVGVESTIVQWDGSSLNLLRWGGLDWVCIEDFAQKWGLKTQNLTTDISQKSQNLTLDVPGRSLKHYAPDIPCYMVTKSLGDKNADYTIRNLSHVCVLDYGQKLLPLADKVKSYFDLSVHQNPKEAGYQLFFLLRSLEKQTHIECLIFPDFSPHIQCQDKALFDRIYRACQGKKIFIGDFLSS